MNLDRLKAQLKRHEGCKRDPQTGMLHPYQDTVGVWTGGYGYNFESHGVEPCIMNEDTADNLLEIDIYEADKIARDLFPTFGDLNDARQEVLVNMAYNLGNRLAKFLMLQSAVFVAEWRAAADSMRRSKWASQVGNRATELAKQMESGISTQEV